MLVTVREKMKDILFTYGKPVFTHRAWTGLVMDPVRIEFLDTLPAHMLIRASPVAPQLLQPLKEQLEQFV